MLRYFISGTLSPDEFVEEGRSMEKRWINAYVAASAENRKALSESAFEEDERLVMKQLADAKNKQIAFTRGNVYYRLFWKKKTKKLI